ncbi:MAG: 3-hydroxyacyl-CoA dehydrogenase NAD-binding domain-containing protein [Gaiellaceae bacterium]
MGETEFKLQRVETRVGPLALVTIDNGEDHTKPTVFGRNAFASAQRLLDDLEAGEWQAMVLTGKPCVFAAGADIDEFPRLRTREEAVAGGRAGHELFARIRALPFLTVAAVNGACLGGGVEIALHCDARTISSGVRHLALPECFLGIIPGWGGTQLVPRLVGAQTAVRFVVQNPLRQNRMLSGAEAVEYGLADRLLEPVEFLDESINFALELLDTGGMRREPADLSDVEEVVRRARTQLDDTLHGAAPAPYRALELIEGAAQWTIEEGYRAEEEATADLLLGPQAEASLYAFDLVERRAKRRRGIPDAALRPIRKVGIAGAGLMASQLATLFLRRLEVPVVLRDVRAEAISAALDAIRGELAAQVAKGRYDEGKARFLGELALGSTEYEGWEDCDLVLEAVFEDTTVKKEVFADIEALVSPECVLATNTSALSVTEIGADLEHPERLVGMHFFNPVGVMPLVELVRTPETDDVTLATAATACERLRKRPVLVMDAPGFVVNRVLTRMTGALMDALEHGNTVEETDEAVLRLGLPMAPSVLLQMVGPRVAYHVLETMHAAFPGRFPLSHTLRNYAEGRDEVAVAEHRPWPVEELTEAVLEALADEIRHLLEEGVVPDAADVDTCLLLGAGFPFFLGGITKHLDQTGVSDRVAGRPLAEVRAAAPA